MSKYYLITKEVFEYCTLIKAYLVKAIDYATFMDRSKNYIAYHNLTNKQLLQAYAVADAFFLEPTQIEIWFEQVLHDPNEEDIQYWQDLYIKYQRSCPHSTSFMGAMEQQ